MSQTPPPRTPPEPDGLDTPLRRYDLKRGIPRFQSMLRRSPGKAIGLAVAFALLGAALAFEWVPRSAHRARWDAGVWALAIAAWMLAAWCLTEALIGWFGTPEADRERPPPPR